MDPITLPPDVQAVTALKLAGDYLGATEHIARALQQHPDCFRDPAVWNLLMNQPAVFNGAQDYEANVLFATAVMVLIDALCNELDPASGQSLADAFLLGAQFRLTAHSDVDVKDLMLARARLFMRSSLLPGERDHVFASPVSNQWKPRLGVIFRHLRADPETTSILPFYSQAKRSGIEVFLFVLDDQIVDSFGSELADHADHVVKLPSQVADAVKTIREADLDILLFGNDITAKASLGACLSMHRLARRSICTVSTLVTTGSPYVDEYFGCDFHKQRGANGEFFERYTSLPNPGFAFRFASESNPSKVTINRAQLGLGPDTVLFVSGANHTKLHGAVLDTWARILRQVPDSALFLYPFPPHFGPTQETVISRIRKRFEEQGVHGGRIIVLPTIPGRQAVISLLRQMDIGLDSFPYPGVTTIVDAIEAQLPTVTLAGRTLRSAQGAAVLSSAGIEELITHDEDAYVSTSVMLAQQPALRKAVAERLRSASGSLSVLDEVRFGRAAVREYFRIHEELKQERIAA